MPEPGSVALSTEKVSPTSITLAYCHFISFAFITDLKLKRGPFFLILMCDDQRLS